MKKILYVSPHLDDALLSMAQNMKNEIADGEDVTVISVFTEGNDETARFYEQRRNDDIRAIASIGAHYIHLGFQDSYFREPKGNDMEPYHNFSTIMFHKSADDKSLFNELNVALRRIIFEFDIVYFPLSVGGHVDHTLVFLCAYEYWKTQSVRLDIRFYADMPYSMIDGNVDIRIQQCFGYKTRTEPIKPLLENDLFFLKNYCEDADDESKSTMLFQKEVENFNRCNLTNENDYFPVVIPVDAEEFDKSSLISNYGSEVGDLFGSRIDQVYHPERYFIFKPSDTSIHFVRNTLTEKHDYCAKIKVDRQGTVMRTDVIYYDDSNLPIYDQVYYLFEKLRVLGCMYNLNPQGFKNSFQAEDIFEAELFYNGGNLEDLEFLKRFVPRLVAPNCKLIFSKSDNGKLGIMANFLLKSVETPSGKKYSQNSDGTINCESFEVHISEHCNLRCVQCCNVSPFNKPKFLSVQDIERQFSFLKRHLNPDVIKISGGEPLLNPEIGKIIEKIKEFFPTTPLRVTTNGLLINRLSEESFAKLDQLWVSNYSSMPNSERNIERIFALARKYEIVLNIKDVTEFSKVLPDNAISKIQAEDSFRNCWMRHRCLMIRNGRFFKCTRAAYIDDYLKNTKQMDTDYAEKDGVLLSSPDFNDQVLRLLNSDIPIDSCVYCYGNTGGSFPQMQMPISH